MVAPKKAQEIADVLDKARFFEDVSQKAKFVNELRKGESGYAGVDVFVFENPKRGANFYYDAGSERPYVDLTSDFALSRKEIEVLNAVLAAM